MAITTEVGTSLTTILTIPAKFSSRIGIQVENDDGAALNAFQVQARVSKDTDNWVSIATGDMTTQQTLWNLQSTSDISTLGTEAEGQLFFDGGYAAEVRLQASVGSGTTNTTVYAIAA